jgi:hypothetical protein
MWANLENVRFGEVRKSDGVDRKPKKFMSSFKK